MLINRTCHEVIDLDSGFAAGPAPYADVIRVSKTCTPFKTVMDSIIYEPKEELTGNIPEKRDGVLYIVSKKVAELIARSPKYRDRDDFIYPTNIEHENHEVPMIDGYGNLIRDSKGNPVTHRIKKVKGCHGFERIKRDKV